MTLLLPLHLHLSLDLLPAAGFLPFLLLSLQIDYLGLIWALLGFFSPWGALDGPDSSFATCRRLRGLFDCNFGMSRPQLGAKKGYQDPGQTCSRWNCLARHTRPGQ